MTLERIGPLRAPDYHGFLSAWQREADRQAARWIEREIAKLMRRDAGAPFDGHQPRLSWRKVDGCPMLAASRVSVRRFDIPRKATP